MVDPVRVIIVHWNKPEACLDTVARFANDAEPTVITVVDNGSERAARDHVAAGVASDVRFIDAGENLGFGPGANVGFRDWLDNDVGEWALVAPHDAMPEPDTLTKLMAVLRARSGVGVASADVGDGETPIVYAYLGAIGGPATVDAGWEPSDYPHGTLMAIRRSCAEEIGLFDERYFAYCEEADLGLRAKDAGWEVGIVRGALVHNPQMGPSAALIDYLQIRNTVLLLHDHFGWKASTFRWFLAWAEIAIGVFLPHRRTPFHTPRSRAKGLVDVARGRFGPPPPGLT